jgi:hypothetical protein
MNRTECEPIRFNCVPKSMKRSKTVKSWEGTARPSDRIYEKKLEEIKVHRAFFEYTCKIDGQTNGL